MNKENRASRHKVQTRTPKHMRPWRMLPDPAKDKVTLLDRFPSTVNSALTASFKGPWQTRHHLWYEVSAPTQGRRSRIGAGPHANGQLRTNPTQIGLGFEAARGKE